MKTSYQPFVSIIGAGPGDLELITIKGMNALKKADIILYDALVNKDMLCFTKSSAIKIFVGKRSNNHSFSQKEINQLIVESALNHGRVVRLKGGDPFVFGRGQEEVEHLQDFGIPYEIIPGISSSIGAATLNGIPLTKRGVNQSFWVLTATTKDGSLSQDLSLAAQSTATSVILMGTKKVTDISELYTSKGKENTPVAFIENASMPNERIILSTVKNMFQTSLEQSLKSPAIILIGEVVASHPEFISESIKDLIEHS